MDKDTADNAGFTALMLASWRGHVEAVHLLLEFGVAMNLANCIGLIAFMLASEEGHAEVVRLLEASAIKDTALKS